MGKRPEKRMSAKGLTQYCLDQSPYRELRSQHRLTGSIDRREVEHPRRSGFRGIVVRGSR